MLLRPYIPTTQFFAISTNVSNLMEREGDPPLAALLYEVRSDETINSIRQKRAPGTSVHTVGIPLPCRVRGLRSYAPPDISQGCRIKKINRVIPKHVRGKSGEPCFPRSLHPVSSLRWIRCAVSQTKKLVRDTIGWTNFWMWHLAIHIFSFGLNKSIIRKPNKIE